MKKSTQQKKIVSSEIAIHRDPEAFIDDVRTRYAAGTLPQWKIGRLEKIPGWCWVVASGKMTCEAQIEDRLVRRVIGESLNA
jgi:hypothetical protein